MRSFGTFTVFFASCTCAALLGGCISTSREVHEPAPVVQVTPPPVTVTTPPLASQSSTTQSTTTSWGDGSVIRKQTTSADSNGVVQKQTTTTWSNGSEGSPETSVTTTTRGWSTN